MPRTTYVIGVEIFNIVWMYYINYPNINFKLSFTFIVVKSFGRDTANKNPLIARTDKMYPVLILRLFGSLRSILNKVNRFTFIVSTFKKL